MVLAVVAVLSCSPMSPVSVERVSGVEGEVATRTVARPAGVSSSSPLAMEATATPSPRLSVSGLPPSRAEVPNFSRRPPPARVSTANVPVSSCPATPRIQVADHEDVRRGGGALGDGDRVVAGAEHLLGGGLVVEHPRSAAEGHAGDADELDGAARSRRRGCRRVPLTKPLTPVR